MVLSDKDKIFIKRLYLNGYTAQRLTDEFLKNAGQSVVLINANNVAGHRQFTDSHKFEFLISQGSVATRLR